MKIGTSLVNRVEQMICRPYSHKLGEVFTNRWKTCKFAVKEKGFNILCKFYSTIKGCSCPEALSNIEDELRGQL